MSRKHKNRPIQRLTINDAIDTIKYELQGSLDEAIAYLQVLHQHYPNGFIRYEDISVPYSSDEQYGFRLYNSRPETDEELALRVEQEAKYAADQDERDRVAYARLKEKFKD